jgi:hypothetical protein
MRKPKHQAEFLKLLAKALCYSLSGNNDVGFISKGEWNPYWRKETGLNVYSPPCPLLSYFPELLFSFLCLVFPYPVLTLPHFLIFSFFFVGFIL